MNRPVSHPERPCLRPACLIFSFYKWGRRKTGLGRERGLVSPELTMTRVYGLGTWAVGMGTLGGW
jgi:hypothetical protein